MSQTVDCVAEYEDVVGRTVEHVRVQNLTTSDSEIPKTNELDEIVPQTHAKIRVVVYSDRGLLFVFGPPIQYPNGLVQNASRMGQFVASYELEGNLIPAIPERGLQNDSALASWISSLQSKGVCVRKIG